MSAWRTKIYDNNVAFDVKEDIQTFDFVAKVTNRRATQAAFDMSYRGCCEIKRNQLASLVIETVDKIEIAYEHTSLCNVSFISPKDFPGSLWVGKVLEMYEGVRTVGEMKIIEIINGSLDRNKIFEDREDILSDAKSLNIALKLSLEWGKEHSKPLENKIMYSIPKLSGNDIQRISDYITQVRDDVLWKIYYDHYDYEKQELTIDAIKETTEKYPWINGRNLRSLDYQGTYYAWHG